MIIVQKPDQLEGNNTVLTLGFFDGVHRGHRALTDLVLKRASELNLHSAVLTFWPHPRLVLNKDPLKLRFLTTLNEKTKIFSRLGYDFFIIQEFNNTFAHLTAEDFIKLIVTSYNVKHLIIGKEHRFGRNAQGNINTIAQLASKYDYTFEEVDIIEQNETNISSTKIREALIKGEIEKANLMLGYPYLLSGTIESGSQLGRKIGFPTANVRPIDPLKLIPSDGVYAVIVNVNGQFEKGMMNIGFRPTVDKTHQHIIEFHIFNFNQDIYYQRIDVAIIERVRDEKQFRGIDELKAQLEIDKVNIMNILNVYELNNFENYFITLPRSTEL